MTSFDDDAPVDEAPVKDEDGIARRGFLQCMAWAGTGVLWTLSGGLPQAMGLSKALAAEPMATAPFTFLQISDSHVGFDKPANPDALATLRQAIDRIKLLPVKPSFMIHTGDISHLSKDKEFDDADQVIKQAGLPVFYVPGEHDLLDDEQGKAYLDRYGKGTRGAGWYSFDQQGVHFIGLVNVVDLKAGGFGNLGEDQLEWLENDVAGLSSSTPIVVFAHIPTVDRLSRMGLGHHRQRPGPVIPEAVRLGDGAQRAHPSGHAEGGRQCRLPHRALHRVSPARPRLRSLAGADEGGRRRPWQISRRRDRRFRSRRRTAGDHRQAAGRLTPPSHRFSFSRYFSKQGAFPCRLLRSSGGRRLS